MGGALSIRCGLVFRPSIPRFCCEDPDADADDCFFPDAPTAHAFSVPYIYIQLLSPSLSPLFSLSSTCFFDRAIHPYRYRTNYLKDYLICCFFVLLSKARFPLCSQMKNSERARGVNEEGNGRAVAQWRVGGRPLLLLTG
jgi:hypothetical protein